MGRQIDEEDIGKQGLFSKVWTGPFGACFLFSHGHAAPLGNRICGAPHSSEVCTVSQISALRGIFLHLLIFSGLEIEITRM